MCGRPYIMEDLHNDIKITLKLPIKIFYNDAVSSRCLSQIAWTWTRILIVLLPFKLLFKLIFDTHRLLSIPHIFTCIHRHIHLIPYERTMA